MSTERPLRQTHHSVAIGTAVTIHTDGAQITATTTNGVATITKKLGIGAAGTEALVRFI